MSKTSKNRVLVLGFFGYDTNQLDGQTLKTRNIFDLLKSEENRFFSTVSFFDTQRFKKDKKYLLKLVKEIWNCDTLIYIPAQNNLKYLFPFIYLIAKAKNIRVHYIVVGGWLAEFVKDKKLHRTLLSKISHIYPQSEYMTVDLKERFGFSNVTTLNNYRIHGYTPAINPVGDPIKLVFMARIHPLKGIDYIFELAQSLKAQNIKNVTIDLYGPIWKEYHDEFFTKLSSYEDTVIYKRALQPDEIYKVLNDYDLMLFPTCYYTEGFPGSVLDAYIAGIPVIATKWKHATEFIDDGQSGIITEFGDSGEFVKSTLSLVSDSKKIEQMKVFAYQKSKQYSVENAWEVLKRSITEHK